MTEPIAVKGALRRLHYGPGDHPSGSPQSVHAGKDGSKTLDDMPDRISHSDIVKSKSVKWGVTRGGRVETLPYEGTTHSDVAEVAGIKSDRDFHIRGYSANLKNRDGIADVFYIINLFGMTSDRAILNLNRVAKEVERFGPEMRDKPRAIYFSYDGGSTAQKVGVEELTERGLYIIKGGPGSGHHGHAGRPGKVGGSAPAGQSSVEDIRIPNVRGGGWWQDNPQQKGFSGAAEWLKQNPNTPTAGYNEAKVDPKDIVKLPGARGEQDFINWDKVARLAESMKVIGMEYKPLIIIEQDRTAYIWEGNHRVRAAIEAGLETITVEIRYFGGSEEKEGIWEPRLVERGGLGSGHFGHAGRPGKVGGSAPKGSVAQGTPVNSFSNEVTAAYSGQINGSLIAYDENGDYLGHIDWREFEGDVDIAWITVKEKMRRKGIATALVKQLAKEFEGQKIYPTMTTREGTAFLDSIKSEGIIVFRHGVQKAANRFMSALERLFE